MAAGILQSKRVQSENDLEQFGWSKQSVWIKNKIDLPDTTFQDVSIIFTWETTYVPVSYNRTKKNIFMSLMAQLVLTDKRLAIKWSSHEPMSPDLCALLAAEICFSFLSVSLIWSRCQYFEEDDKRLWQGFWTAPWLWYWTNKRTGTIMK